MVGISYTRWKLELGMNEQTTICTWYWNDKQHCVIHKNGSFSGMRCVILFLPSHDVWKTCTFNLRLFQQTQHTIYVHMYIYTYGKMYVYAKNKLPVHCSSMVHPALLFSVILKVFAKILYCFCCTDQRNFTCAKLHFSWRNSFSKKQEKNILRRLRFSKWLDYVNNSSQSWQIGFLTRY